MRTILITGFGRFPGAPVNPSGVIAARLARRRRPALAATRRVAHVFPTCYAAIDRELPALLARERPAVVVLFGLAGRARQVRIEEWARNRLSAFPDAERRRPAGRIIAPRMPPRRTTAPVVRLVAAVRATGLMAAPSRNAGGYICNYAYWHALGGERRPGDPVVVFVHVPPVALNKRPKPATGETRHRGARRRGQRAVRLGDLIRAGEAILVALGRQVAP